VSRKELPIDWMLSDLQGALDHGMIYLAALGLVAYTEMLGRESSLARGIRGKKESECFDYFVSEFMRYPCSLLNDGRTYDSLRNGLAHEYFIKPPEGTVAHKFPDGYDPDGTKPGIEVDSKGALLAFILEPYFRDFSNAARTWKAERAARLANSITSPPRSVLPGPLTHPASAAIYPPYPASGTVAPDVGDTRAHEVRPTDVSGGNLPDWSKV